MLTTSTILMSLGSDLANTHQISPDRIDTPTFSFAESFDNSVPALGGEMPLQTDNGKKNKSEWETRYIVSSVKVGGVDSAGAKTKANATATGVIKVQEKSKNISNSVVSKNATVATTTTGGTFSDDDKSHEDILAIHAEIAKSQLLTGNLKGIEQNPIPQVVDSVTPESDNQTDTVKIEVAASAVSPILDNGMTAAVQNKREILISNKNENPLLSKKMAKDHNVIAKTEKLLKLEGKTKKDEPVGKVIEAGQIMNIPSLDIQANRQHNSNTGQDDLLSSPDFEAPERSADMNPILAGKLDHKTQGAGKIDDDSVKTAASPVDDASLQKVGTDLSKADLFTIPMVAGDSEKAQSAVIAGGAIVSTHTEPGMVVATAGVASAVVAAQIVMSKDLTLEGNSHTANAHADTVIDASGTIEVPHHTLMATPTSLEVGLVNGTHGWVKIRAEMTGGGVNASLSPATSSGQEMLHRELPSLTAYLQSERVLVNAVVVQPAVVPATNFQQLAGGMNDGGRGQMPQSDGQGGQQGRQDTASMVAHHLEKDGIYRGTGEDKLLPLASYAGGGRWLNVRA